MAHSYRTSVRSGVSTKPGEAQHSMMPGFRVSAQIDTPACGERACNRPYSSRGTGITAAARAAEARKVGRRPAGSGPPARSEIARLASQPCAVPRHPPFPRDGPGPPRAAVAAVCSLRARVRRYHVQARREPSQQRVPRDRLVAPGGPRALRGRSAGPVRARPRDAGRGHADGLGCAQDPRPSRSGPGRALPPTPAADAARGPARLCLRAAELQEAPGCQSGWRTQHSPAGSVRSAVTGTHRPGLVRTVVRRLEGAASGRAAGGAGRGSAHLARAHRLATTREDRSRRGTRAPRPARGARFGGWRSGHEGAPTGPIPGQG